MATKNKCVPLATRLFIVHILFKTLALSSAQQQENSYRQATSQNPIDDKVEIHHPENRNDTEIATRYFTGSPNLNNYNSAGIFNGGPPRHNHKPYFIPSHPNYGNNYGIYGGGGIPFGQGHSTYPYQYHNKQSFHNFYPPQSLPSFGQYPPIIPQKPHFPFNPSPPIDPSLNDAYYASFFGNLPGREPFQNSYQGNHGLGAAYGSGLELGLPRQVKVPGRIEISISGNTATITCEFPRYLILMQKIYWHHKYDDAYGSYYDGTNGFGPRIHVVSTDQWSSSLQIRDFNEDDYGPYRCISAAVLPEDGQANQKHTRNNFRPDRSTTTEANSQRVFTDHPYEFDSGENTKKAKQGKQKNKHSNNPKIRFVRSVKSGSGKKGKIVSKLQETEQPSASNIIGSPEVYDPFNRIDGAEGHYPNPNSYNNPFTNQNENYLNQSPIRTPSFYGPGPSTPSPSSLPLNLQNYYYNQRYPPQFPDKYPNFPYVYPSSYGLNAPFYKPRYSVFTVYQEITFAPVTSLDYKSTSPSPTTTTGK